MKAPQKEVVRTQFILDTKDFNAKMDAAIKKVKELEKLLTGLGIRVTVKTK